MLHLTQTADIAAANSFTTPIPLKAGEFFAASISGSFSATGTVQRSLDGGITWDDLASSTGPMSWDLRVGASCQVRAGIKAGNYTGGTLHAVVKYG